MVGTSTNERLVSVIFVLNLILRAYMLVSETFRRR
jgi:hypothetical protein